MDDSITIETMNHGEDEKKLIASVIKGNWTEVIKIYEENSWACKAKINRFGDTALHVAVSDGKEDTVESPVRLLICQNKEALKIENEQGNTALHFAASMGNVRMCECIVEQDLELVGVRNMNGETPFFLAALHGKTDAFLSLHNAIAAASTDRDIAYSYCRRKDGETILHFALIRDYFELAYEIIHRYNNLVHYFNERGFSPLHLLASMPFAFKSSLHMSWFDSLIYHCIFVEELPKANFPPEKKPNYLVNYETCIDVFRLLQNFIRPVAQKTAGRADAENPGPGSIAQGSQSTNELQGCHQFPSNYHTCYESIKFVYHTCYISIKFVSVAVVFYLGGSTLIRKLRNKKEKHTWSIQIMNELLRLISMDEYQNDGKNPHRSPASGREDNEIVSYVFEEQQQQQMTPTAVFSVNNSKDQNKEKSGKDKNEEGDDKSLDWRKGETAILIAAKNGVTEMVEQILKHFPVAVYDVNTDNKNIVLLAVENRQPHLYILLQKILKDSAFRTVDNKGNSTLHIAATLGNRRPWLTPGAALQMQWEFKWYEFVKDSKPKYFFDHYNNEGKTPKDVFTETHKGLVKEGKDWLTSTSNSLSGVAAVIATVAFATSTTVPGGAKDEINNLTPENKLAFNVFAISSLIALCSSISSVLLFFSILISRYQERDFGEGLPKKLLLSLTSLFIALASMLISFYAGHYFLYRENLKIAAFPIYAATCLPLIYFTIVQLPWYFHLIWTTCIPVPQRSYQVLSI